MPKKKSVTNERIISRPQRNMKAKVVFDPSDYYIPKKKKKFDEKKDEDINISKKPVDNKKKNQNIKSNINSDNIELFDNPSNEIIHKSPAELSPKSSKHSSMSPENSSKYLKRSSRSSKKSNNSSKSLQHLSRHPEDSLPNTLLANLTPEIFEEEVLCFMCSETVLDQELIDCPFCIKKVHKECLIIGEPIWKFKLKECPWFCDKCRKTHCSQCLDIETQLDKLYHCMICNVGLHRKCFEECKDKPFQEIRINMHLCIPCMTLATEKLPEEEEDFYESNSSGHISLVTSDEDDDNDSNSLKSHNTSNTPQNGQKRLSISDVINWNKIEIFKYFSDRGLPSEVTEKIIKYEIDGRAVQLLKREDITLSMELKLGLAMKFYKEVRLLQSQSLYYSTIWE